MTFIFTALSARPAFPAEREIERNISLGVIVVVTLVSGALLILNFILISCYVKRKADGKLLLGKQALSTKHFTSIEAGKATLQGDHGGRLQTLYSGPM